MKVFVVVLTLLALGTLGLPRPLASPVRAQTVSTSVTPPPTSPTATPDASAPQIHIYRVAMLRPDRNGHYHGVTRVRIGQLMRLVAYYRVSNGSGYRAHIHISIYNAVKRFYDSDLNRDPVEKYFYVAGRFHAVIGPVTAIFVGRLGPARDVQTLLVHVRLPAFKVTP